MNDLWLSFRKSSRFVVNSAMCKKKQVKFANISFCSEEVPVEVTSVGSESHIRLMDPISRVVYGNHTLTMGIEGFLILLT